MDANPFGFWENVEEMYKFFSTAKYGLDYSIWLITQHVIDTKYFPDTYIENCLKNQLTIYDNYLLSDYLKSFYSFFNSDIYLVMEKLKYEDLCNLVILLTSDDPYLFNFTDKTYYSILFTCELSDYYYSLFNSYTNSSFYVKNSNLFSEQKFVSDFMYVDATLYETHQKRVFPHHKYFTRGWRSSNFDQIEYPYWGWSFFEMPILHNHSLLNYYLKSWYVYKDYLYTNSHGQNIVYIYDYMQLKIPHIKMHNGYFPKPTFHGFYNDSMNKHDYLHHDYKYGSILTNNYYLNNLKNSYLNGIYSEYNPHIWKDGLKGCRLTYYECYGSPEPTMLNAWGYWYDSWRWYWNKTVFYNDMIVLLNDNIRFFNLKPVPRLLPMNWIPWDKIADDNIWQWVWKKTAVKKNSLDASSFFDED